MTADSRVTLGYRCRACCANLEAYRTHGYCIVRGCRLYDQAQLLDELPNAPKLDQATLDALAAAGEPE